MKQVIYLFPARVVVQLLNNPITQGFSQELHERCAWRNSIRIPGLLVLLVFTYSFAHRCVQTFDIENNWEIKEKLAHIPIRPPILCELPLSPVPPARCEIDASVADSSSHEEQRHLKGC